MLSRRQFLRYSALVTAGVIAADQLEILDRLAPRSLFAGWDRPQIFTLDMLYHRANGAIGTGLQITLTEDQWFRGVSSGVVLPSGAERRIIYALS